MRRWLAALLLGLCLVPFPAHAVEPDEILPDAALEARARSLSEGLRCLVCQNQSIDDSHATLARDLRLLVRERLKAGDTDQQIRDALVARYGAFVLLKPPFDADTALLWATPALVLGGGALGLWLARRGRAPVAREAPLTDEEEEAIRRLARSRRGL